MASIIMAHHHQLHQSHAVRHPSPSFSWYDAQALSNGSIPSIAPVFASFSPAVVPVVPALAVAATAAAAAEPASLSFNNIKLDWPTLAPAVTKRRKTKSTRKGQNRLLPATTATTTATTTPAFTTTTTASASSAFSPMMMMTATATATTAAAAATTTMASSSLAPSPTPSLSSPVSAPSSSFAPTSRMSSPSPTPSLSSAFLSINTSAASSPSSMYASALPSSSSSSTSSTAPSSRPASLSPSPVPSPADFIYCRPSSSSVDITSLVERAFFFQRNATNPSEIVATTTTTAPSARCLPHAPVSVNTATTTSTPAPPPTTTSTATTTSFTPLDYSAHSQHYLMNYFPTDSSTPLVDEPELASLAEAPNALVLNDQQSLRLVHSPLREFPFLVGDAPLPASATAAAMALEDTLVAAAAAAAAAATAASTNELTTEAPFDPSIFFSNAAETLGDSPDDPEIYQWNSDMLSLLTDTSSLMTPLHSSENSEAPSDDYAGLDTDSSFTFEVPL